METLGAATTACEQLRTEAGLAADADVSALIVQSERKQEIGQCLAEAEQELLPAGDGMPEPELRNEVADAMWI